MARAVRFDLITDSSKFTRGMRDAQRSSERFTQHTTAAGGALKAATAAFSVGIVVNQMKNWVAAARDSNRVAAQTAAVIKSTHGAAGLSAKGFADLAKSIEKTTAVDDDLIQGGEAIIATFTNIHGDVFKKTTQAAVDLAAGMNHGQVTAEGLQTASIQLGKALQDPIKGVTALQRIGIKLNDQQKAQIATFVKNGQVAKAQGVILAEVNRQFGGSAAAAVTPAKRLAQQWGDMQEVLGNLLIPAIDRGAQILGAILGVVDRNRTAFGVLFGVLGTGAAIIGTLVVAEKIHKATTEGIAAATKAWEGLQKGLNLVLGTTKVQAVATAAAEDTLAVSTTAAGTATKEAALASTGLVAGLGRLIPIIGLAAIGFQQYQKTTKEVADLTGKARQQAELGIGPHRQLGLTVAQAAEAWRKEAGATKDAGKVTGDNALVTAYNAKQQAALRLEMLKLFPQYATAADKALLNRDAIDKLSFSLGKARDELRQHREAMAKTIESYDGLLSKSKVTAASIINDIRKQTANFRTFAADVQTLIRKGVGRDALGWLEEKGPEYVHGLAVGTDRQLAVFQENWRARGQAIKGPFAKAMNEQYAKLKKTIEDMKDKINELSGKTIYITAKASVKINKSVEQYLAAANVPGFHAKGALIPGYGGGDIYPAMLEPGEAVVPKEKARRPDFKAWAGAQGIPGYQMGGLVTRFYKPTVRQTGRVGQSMADVAAAVLGRAAALPSYGGGAGSGLAMKVAQWTIAALHRPLAEIGAWFRRLMFESGGNPRAINRWDSNWAAGHPSVGIAQVIRGTFQANAGRYRGVGPFAYGVSMDPYANSFAGAHYGLGRYNSLFALDPRVRPRGYDRGGWLPPGTSVAFNGTGRAEPVGFDYDKLAVTLAAVLLKALAGMGIQLNGQKVGELVVEPYLHALYAGLNAGGRA